MAKNKFATDAPAFKSSLRHAKEINYLFSCQRNAC